MRFPSFTELDEKQKAIFAALSGEKRTMLVAGPPGTGKTVLAFFRAKMLSERDRKPTVIMYNKVLTKYAGSQEGKANERVMSDYANISTMHSWTPRWWRSSFGDKPPGQNYSFDWSSMLETSLQRLMSEGFDTNRIDWGDLIVDEGQDFPSKMYFLLRTLSEPELFWKGSTPPSVCVFADENQRLSPDKNSTIKDIREALGISDADSDSFFYVSKNYRNTREISAFASHFYCGLPTGRPDPPARSGDLPVVSISPNVNTVAERIARYARSSRGKEIGVLCEGKSQVNAVVHRLSSQLNKHGIRVQAYLSKHPEHTADSLVFDTGDVVTVLTYQSAKGLEFDAVFLLDPFPMMGKASIGQDQVKMTLYVMCSRARDYLEICLYEESTLRNLQTLSQELPPADCFELEDLRDI